jgi:hypothetical protein
MQYTAKQKAEFRARFFQKRLYHIASTVPVVGAVVLLLVSDSYLADLDFPIQTMALGTAGLVLAAAAFSWFNWRCPACAKYLGFSLSPNSCRNCGVALS